MINMMYLVLTALLALNVSAEILLSFQTIADSLEKSAESTGHRNQELADRVKESVQKMVEKGTAKPYHKQIPAQIDETTKKTEEMINFLQQTIDKLSSPPISEKDPETGRIANLGESEKNYRYLMFAETGGSDLANSRRGDGRANETRKRLIEYVDWANKVIEEYSKAPDAKPEDKVEAIKFDYLTLDPKDDKKIPAGSESKQYPWEYHTFHGAPVIANVAIFEKLKSDINSIEAQLLEALKRKLVDIPPFKIDSLVAVQSLESQTVIAGQQIVGRIFVTAISNQMKPKFSGNGVTTERGGNVGVQKIMAQANVIPAGKYEGDMMISSSVVVKGTGGRDQTLNVKSKVKVVKPVVDFQSAAVQVLYSNCSNPMKVNCPQLEFAGLYKPEFKAEGGSVAVSPKVASSIKIIPTGKTVNVQVFNRLGGQLTNIGGQKFNVINPPKPNIVTQVNGKEWNGRDMITSRSKVSIIIKSNPDFKKQLPDDARYSIAGLAVKKKSGLGDPKPIKTYGGVDAPAGGDATLNMDLTGIWGGAGGGNGSIIFQISDIARISTTPAGRIKENFSERELIISGFVEDR